MNPQTRPNDDLSIPDTADERSLVSRNAPWQESGFFRTAIDGHEDAFWVFDPENRELVFGSAALRDRWGLGPEDFRGDGRLALERVDGTERGAALEAIRNGLQSGAFDFQTMLRDRDGASRHVRVWGALEIWPAAGRPLFVGWLHDLTRETELAALVETYRNAAETDALTGVANRRGLERRMKSRLAVSESEGLESSAILIDLDDFKAINEGHGHFVGDRVLEIAARRLESELRATDLLGRIGGDEFMVVLPGADPQTGYEVAKRMRVALNSASVQVDSCEIAVRASFALTPIESSPFVGIDDVLRLVRSLMSTAKSLGKDSVRR